MATRARPGAGPLGASAPTAPVVTLTEEDAGRTVRVGDVFPFVALDPGPAPLLLEYRDTTEPDSGPLDTFEATVIIE